MTPPSHTTIIGAGFGGLSAAALLAKQGHNVTVLEQHDHAGGRGRVWQKDGFTFDMGPSWYLMPDVFERYFSYFDKTPADYFTLQRLDPSYRIYFGPKEYQDIPANKAQAKALFEKLEPKDGGKKFDEYLKLAEYQYHTAMDRFIYRDYENIFQMMDPELMTAGFRLKLFRSIGQLVEDMFENPQSRRILLYNIVFLGGAPHNTPALYALMAHIDFNLNVWYPKGGMGQVALGMQKLAEELGVTFQFNTEVTGFKFDNQHITHVSTNQGDIDTDLVIANADYHHVDQQLLPPDKRQYSQKYWDKRTVAPSALIYYLGVNKRLPGLEHHTLFFDRDWQAHFKTIFDKPDWPVDPSFYVCAPSRTDPTVAPKGQENLFVLVPVAAGLTDTPEVRQTYFDQVINRMETCLGTKFKSNIILNRSYAHNDFTADYNAFKGTSLGLSHTLLQTAAMRPRRKSQKIDNLYYTGHYTHPGIGVPMTIIASDILAQRLADE